MLTLFRRWVSTITVLLILFAPAVCSQTNGKKKVSNASDLPRFTYRISGSASELLLADAATFNAFAAKVKADLDSIFRDYEIEDKASLRMLLSVRLDFQQAAGENDLAVETLASLLSLAEKPTDSLEQRLAVKSELQAAVESRATRGADYEQRYRINFRQALDALPPNVAQNAARSILAGSTGFGRDALIGEVKADFDPSVQKSGVLDNKQAWTLINMRNTLQIYLPLNDVTLEVLRQYVATHSTKQFDIWPAREVTLSPDQKLTPVPVAIWDSGVDVSLFPDQLFIDPHPTASGTHGIAFDGDGTPSKSWLFPLTEAQERQYREYLAEAKGMQDLLDGIDSSEARALQNEARVFTVDQIRARHELERTFSHYGHGTHVAGIVARGNPAVRLVVARFDADITQLPFQPTVEWARRLAADFQQMSEYFRTRNVRVVNMSWLNDPDEFERWLSNTGGGADPAERKRRAGEMYAVWRDAIESAIRNAPNTLFVCVAGNSNRDAGFAQDVPASLHLPNLISVGAVDSAGKETSFSSRGDTVVVYADGYDVESFVPGGLRLKESGTSMAAPNVANLAAKLIAIDPSLTPLQVIELIKRGATTSDDGRMYLIFPVASVALLKASK